MFFFGDLPEQITQQSANASQHIWHAVQGQDLAKKALEALAGWFVGFSATQLKARLDDRDRRAQRVKLVTEAADVLRLRDQLRSMADTAGNWEVVTRLTPHLDHFAQENLFKVEEQLRALREGKRIIHPRTLLERVFLVFPPRQRWLWIIHTLFFASLSSALTILFGIVEQIRSNHVGVWDSIYDARFSALGVLLSAGFFNAVGNHSDWRLECAAAGGLDASRGATGEAEPVAAIADSAGPNPAGVPAPGDCDAERSWPTRVFLLFAPRNGWMWTGHLLFFGFIGVALRYLPRLFKDDSATDLIVALFLVVLFVVPPLVTFNLLSNFGDLKYSQEQIEAHDGGDAVTRALTRNIFRRMFLLYLPARWWLGPAHLFYYFCCLIMLIGVFLLAVTAVTDPGTADAFIVLTIAWLLPTGVVCLFANLVDAICQLLKRRKTIRLQAVREGLVLKAS